MSDTDARQQVRNSAIYVVPVLVGNLLPLATLPIYLRLVPVHDYGAWALATAYGIFVTGLANFGLTIGYERNFFEQTTPAARAGLLYSTVGFVAAVLAAVLAATAIFSGTLAAWIIGSAAYGPLLFWTAAANGVMSLKAYFLIYFRNTADARAHVWYSLDESVLAAVLGVALVAGAGFGVFGIVFGQLIASAVVFAMLAGRFVRRMPPAFDRRLLAGALRISYPLTPRILLGVAGNQIDKFLLGLIGSVAGVGAYAVGQRIAHIVFNYMTALENVFAPQVYQRMFSLGPAGGDAVGRYLTPFAYLSVAVTLGIGLFAEEVIALLAPAAYHAAIPVATILSLHYGIMFFGKLPQLVYAKKTGIISVLTLVGLLANAGLNILFIRRWGATGAAAGTLTAGLLSVVLVVALGQRYYPIRWQIGPLAMTFGLLFAAVAGSFFLREAGVPYMPRLGVKLAALAMFAAVGVWIGVISRANLLVVRSAFRRRLGVA